MNQDPRHHQPQPNYVYLLYFNYHIIILPQPSGVAGRRPFQGQTTPGNISVYTLNLYHALI